MCDVFLSHAWGHDRLGNDTHRWVVDMAWQLRSVGVTVWLDEDQMWPGCNTELEMLKGIETCCAVVVVLTHRYLEKVNGQNVLDNCVKEFNYARMRRKFLIPVVVEPSLRDPAAWPCGIGSMCLCHTLYVDSCDGSQAAVRALRARTRRRPRLGCAIRRAVRV